jgi:hypothetical protein
VERAIPKWRQVALIEASCAACHRNQAARWRALYSTATL